MTRPLRAVTYLRDSSDQQRLQGTSIPAQRKACADYIQRMGMTLAGEYCDDGFSGRSVKRDRFLALLEDAQKQPRPFDSIVLYDTDRFDRSKAAAMELDRLRSIGIRVEYVVFPIQYDARGRLTPESALTEDQKKAFDRYFSLKLGRDVLRGNKEVTSRGYRVGGSAPFGYRAVKAKDGSAERSTLELDPVTFPVVEKIFALKVQGMGDRKIRDWLNEQGIAPPRKPRFQKITSIVGGVKHEKQVGGWCNQSVARIIDNRVYLGELTYNRRTWVRDFGSQARRPLTNPKADWITIQDAHPRIITPELFDAAQAMRARSKPHASTRGDWHVYLLAGLVKCACGEQMRSLKSIKDGRITRHRYRCSKHGTVLSDGVEKAVLRRLSAVVRDDAAIEKAWVWLSRGKEPVELKKLAKTVDELERRAANVMRAVENGSVELAPRYGEIREQIEAKQREIKSLEASAKHLPRTKAALVRAFAWMAANLDQVDRTTLRSALRGWVGSVTLDIKKRHLTMTYAVPRISEGARIGYCGGWI